MKERPGAPALAIPAIFGLALLGACHAGAPDAGGGAVAGGDPSEKAYRQPPELQTVAPLGQDRLELGHVARVPVVVRACVQHETRVRGRVRQLQRKALEHGAVAFRPKMVDALAEFGPPQIGRRDQRQPHRLPAGEDAGIQRIGDPHPLHHRPHRRVRPRHVGQQQRPLAGVAQPPQAVHRVRKRVHPVVDDAP